MAMDKSMLQNFLSERAGEVKHASSLLSDALLTDDAKGTNANPATRNASKAATPSAAASAGETGGGEKGGNDEQDVVFSDPRALLSRRARGMVDDLLHDPDIERLTGRASGFARERLLQAEAAARVLKGEDEAGEEGGEGEGNGIGGVGGEGGVGRNGVRGVGAAVAQVSSVREGRGGKGGHTADGSGDALARESSGGGGGGGEGSETPILSGLAKEAREFVAGKVEQAHDGAREVVEAAMEVRRSHRPVEKESVDRKEGGAARGVDAADGKGGQGASDDTKVGGDGKEGGGR